VTPLPPPWIVKNPRRRSGQLERSLVIADTGVCARKPRPENKEN
jgi:hypothetical protein